MASSYLLDYEDGALVPRSIGDENGDYVLAPFLDAGGEVLVIKYSSESLQTLDGISRDTEIPGNYPIQALRLENGSLLVLSNQYTPREEGSTSYYTNQVYASLSLLTWNHTFDAYDRNAVPLTLPSSLTSSVTTFRHAPGKMVSDGEVRCMDPSDAQLERFGRSRTPHHQRHRALRAPCRCGDGPQGELPHQQQLRLGLDAGGRPSHVLRAQQPLGGRVRTQRLGHRVHDLASRPDLCELQFAHKRWARHRHRRPLDGARDRRFGDRRNAALCASAARGSGR